MSSTAIVIKTYPKDYGWLAYCLKSIAKYCTGFSEVIVIRPREHPLGLTAETEVPVDIPEGYLSQQVCKLNADLHTKADFVLHVDSDMVFTRPVTPDYFFHEGKPVWVTGSFDSISKKAWFHVMAKCLQACPPAEFMRKCAIIAPRWIYAEFRKFIEATHNMTMEAYIMSQPGHEFSEYNCLGFYAHLHHPEAFHWVDLDKEPTPDWPFVQKWSWGGLTPEIRAELEQITL